MKLRRFLLALGLIVLSRGGIYAQTAAEVYQSLSEYFGFGVDANAGLTTFPSLSIPMGGIAEGLGMATTALAQDSSYFEANPAASSLLPSAELAVYHNNWIADTRIESAVYTVRYKDLGIGAACKWLYLPFTSYDQYGDREGSGYYSEAIAAFNISYNFFSGYYFNGLALGATAKAAYRSVPAAAVGEALAAGNSALGVMADFGALTRFNFLKFYSSRSPNCSFGLALRNLGPPVLEEPLPTVASAGFGFSPLRPLTILLDVSKPINLVDPSASGGFIYATGAELAMTNSFGLHAGFLLKGGNPRLSVGSSFVLDVVKLTLNYTLDLTTQLTPLNRVSIAAAFNLGDGGRAELAKKVESQYLIGLDAYARGDTDAAVAAWREALKLDPRFDPARESLRVIQGSVDLQKNIEQIQKLD
jgi:tetratricopeptide (TPR) repeat protein